MLCKESEVVKLHYPANLSPMPTTAPQIEWLRKDEAAKRLNMSTRSVLAMAADGKIQRKPERDPATNQVVMLLHAGDIERIAYERDHPEASQAVQAVAPQPSHANGAIKPGGEQALLAMLAHAAQPAPAIKPWMTLVDAAEYSGLPETFLRGLVDQGKLPACDVGVRAGGRYRVKRSDLDAIAGDILGS